MDGSPQSKREMVVLSYGSVVREELFGEDDHRCVVMAR